MSIKNILLIVFSLWLNARAQQKWTLKECIAYGLSNNRNQIIYTNDERAADAKARALLADYLPKVSLVSTIDNNLKLQQSVIPAGIFGPDELKVSLSQKYSSNATAQLDQVIYDQSMLIGLRASKYNKLLTELNVDKGKEEIIYNISIAYFQILVYRQQLELLEHNMQTYQKQIEIYRLQVNKGTVLQKDLDKVSVDYNNTISQIRFASSSISLAENELKFEMGYPIGDTLAIDIIVKSQIPLDLAGSVKTFSPSSRIDYRRSEINVKVLEIEQLRIKTEGLPKLSGYFRYGAVGFGNNLNGAYDQLLPFSAVGLKLSIPLFDFFRRRAQYEQAKINRMNATENLKISADRYRVEFEKASSRLLQAQVNLENDQRNVDLAQSVLKVTDLQFQKGTTNLNDWLNTQNALKEAQNSYLKSLYDYYQSRIDLEKATGTLKNFYTSL